VRDENGPLSDRIDFRREIAPRLAEALEVAIKSLTNIKECDCDGPELNYCRACHAQASLMKIERIVVGGERDE